MLFSLILYSVLNFILRYCKVSIKHGPFLIHKICSHHDIAEILLKLAINTNQSINGLLWKPMIQHYKLC